MKDEILTTADTSRPEDLGRRDFMRLFGGGIIIFFSADLPASAFQEPPPMGQKPREWRADGRLFRSERLSQNRRRWKVTVFSGKVELGQSNTTALARWPQKNSAFHWIHPNDHGGYRFMPWDMGTFGSMSVRVYGAALRSAAAEAREILLDLAAERLKTPNRA